MKPNQPRMNKELLNNPEVRDIALKFWALQGDLDDNSPVGSSRWDAFVRKQVAELTWKILSFKHFDEEFVLNDEGRYASELHPGGSYVEAILKNKDFVIEKVQRVSDGAVLCVGETITYYGSQYHINHFTVCDHVLDVYLKEDLSRTFSLQEIEKYKQLLFTTEDQVKVFEGDEVFYVDENFRIKTLKASKDSISDGGFFRDRSTWGFTFFKHMNSVMNHILFKKPCLSLGEILDCESVTWSSPLGSDLREELIRIIKAK